MNAEPVTVRVTQRFTAPPERVFDAWLDPDLIGKWMLGAARAAGREEEIVRISVDARVGGSFSIVVRRDGQELDHLGRYLELDRPRRLAFTWGVDQDAGDSSRVYIDIVPLEGGSELTLTHALDPAWAEYADRTRQGWTLILGAFDEVTGQKIDTPSSQG
jgi:uncharacterized protein YndB with AHSA1/START domain